MMVSSCPGPGGCHFFMERKKRACCNVAKAGQRFCGNHLPSSLTLRVPCPVDPSHSILAAELDLHAGRCPAAKQLKALREQPYYLKDLNSGKEDYLFEGFEEEGNSGNFSTAEVGVASRRFQQLSLVSRDDTVAPPLEGRRRSLAAMLSKEALTALADRVEEAIHASSGRGSPEVAVLCTPACKAWLEGDRDKDSPYQEKHALQQASILGNMEALGLVPQPSKAAEPEQGLHKQTQTQTQQRLGTTTVESIGDCFESSEPSHGSLDSCERVSSYVEFGAGRGYLLHMLSACFPVQNLVFVEKKSYKYKAERALRKVGHLRLERVSIDIADLNLQELPCLRGREFVAVGKHLCGGATDMSLRCCFRGAGPSEAERAAASSAGDDDNGPMKACDKRLLFEENFDDDHARHTPTGREDTSPKCAGVAIATCCHHACDWTSYVGKAFFKRLGFSRQDFELIAWMTSWAVTMADTNASVGGGKQDVSNEDSHAKSGSSSGGVNHASGGGRDKDASFSLSVQNGGSGKSEGVHVSIAASHDDSSRLPKHSDAGWDAKRIAGAKDVAEEVNKSQGTEEHLLEHTSSDNRTSICGFLSREEKTSLGRQCKLLLDLGRIAWVKEQTMAAKIVEYVPSTLTPENRLILAWRSHLDNSMSCPYV